MDLSLYLLHRTGKISPTSRLQMVTASSFLFRQLGKNLLVSVHQLDSYVDLFFNSRVHRSKQVSAAGFGSEYRPANLCIEACKHFLWQNQDKRVPDLREF